MKEIIEKETDQVEENTQKERQGLTKVTSVSVSKFFRDLVDKYQLSPTEVFRRGVAVTLYDLGVEQYNTPTNSARSEYVKASFKEVDGNEKLHTQFKEIELFKAMVNDHEKIKDHAKNIIVTYKGITEKN